MRPLQQFLQMVLLELPWLLYAEALAVFFGLTGLWNAVDPAPEELHFFSVKVILLSAAYPVPFWFFALILYLSSVSLVFVRLRSVEQVSFAVFVRFLPRCVLIASLLIFLHMVVRNQSGIVWP